MNFKDMMELLLKRQGEERAQLRETRQAILEKKKDWKDSVALWVAIMAAVFTGWQGWEAHETRLAADNQFETAQRNARADAEQARKDSEKALQTQAELATRAARQAERSADAAEQSNDVARDALRISQRAYVGIESVKLSREPFAASETDFRHIISIDFDIASASFIARRSALIAKVF